VALIGLLIPLKIDSDFADTMQPLTAFNLLSDTSGVGQIIEAIGEVAIQYGVNEAGMTQLIRCESALNPNAKNPNSTASGLAQFIDGTWKIYCEGEKSSPKDQLICLAKMISKKMYSHWNESRDCWIAYFTH
jgi:hypothetical protein